MVVVFILRTSGVTVCSTTDGGMARKDGNPVGVEYWGKKLDFGTKIQALSFPLSHAAPLRHSWADSHQTR